MLIGRRVLIRNAALLAAAGGCARRIDPPPSVNADLDALGQIRLPASAAPQLQSKGGAVGVHLRDAASGSPLGYGVLVVNLGPRLQAYDRDCPHLGCPLTWVPEDKQIECPCHGSRFASDGALLNPPATTGLNTWPVTVEAAGDFIVHFYPGDGTYPTPDANRKLVLDLANYPALSRLHGYVFGYVEGPPGALLVSRISDTQIAAVDAICTHRFCTVLPKPDGVLHCPCHGSEYNPDGSLMNPPVGPAPSSLRKYPTTLVGQQVTIDLS
jgi:Rieske Fe-S protein